MVTQLVMASLVTVAMLLLSFAPALTYWKKMPTFKAVFYSVVAVSGAVVPVLVMLATVAGLSLLVLSVISIVLGATAFLQVAAMWFMLVISLIVQCAMFAAYKQIMGAPETALTDK